MSYLSKRETNQTDKKIESLKTQLYGKQYTYKVGSSIKSEGKKVEDNITLDSHNNFLAQDLGKSVFLAVVVVVFQFAILFATSHGLVKF